MYCDLPAHELLEMLKKKEIIVSDILECIIQRIRSVEEKVKSYVLVTKDKAWGRVEEIGKNGVSGDYPIPVAIKDNMCIEGIPTTCSSRILEGFIPPYSATVIQKLEKAGAVFIGKTNLDEFAMGSSTENSGFSPTHNPWNLDCVPGGSSGGSAAAVAAGEAIWALGSDTGGSIRQPASFCGVVGLKPTYGRVSRYGLVAFASSLDQIGPITKDVRDSALLLNLIAGHDARDSTSSCTEAVDFTLSLGKDVKGLRAGIPKELMGDGIAHPVREAVHTAIKVLEGQGITVEEMSLPHVKFSLPCYYIIAPAEASSNLARYDGVQYALREKGEDMIDMYKKTRSKGFGAEVKRRIMLGTYALSSGYYDAYYLKAQKVRTLIKSDFDKAFEKYHVIISPTCPTAAFKIGEKTQDPLQMYLSDICTIPVNLAGIPAISIPCGFDNGLPIGLQIMAKPFYEETILQVAYAYEQSTEWHDLRPEITRHGIQ